MPYPSYFGLLLISLVLPLPFGLLLMTLYGASRAIPAFLALRDRGRFVDVLAAHTWTFRLFGHVATGCVTLALGTTILAGVIWT
jgi:hypothetical protein